MKTDACSPSVVHHRIVREQKPRLAYDGGDVRAWQRRLRPVVRRMLLGAMPRTRVPLNVRTLWERPHPLGVIQKIVFTAEPGADVPAFVAIPAGCQPPYPFMICLQGHTTGMHHSIAVQRDDNQLPMEVAGDRDFALGCMRNGFAALCIEQRSFGERREQRQKEVADAGCQDAAMHALMLGRTLMGERVFDVDRGLDYLAARGDADMRRIGVMGNSGGGTISLFSAALLPRVAFAMPSCYFCTFRDSIMSIHHCVDNYVPGLLNVAEMADILGLFAPRPVVVVAGKSDPIFPVAAVRRAFRDLQAIYRGLDAEHCCRLVVGPEGHRFYADLAWPKLLRVI